MIRKRLPVLIALAAALAAVVTSTSNVHGLSDSGHRRRRAAERPDQGRQPDRGIVCRCDEATPGSRIWCIAANAGVWWLFTLTSAADSAGGSNHIVKAYRSSGADLTTAVWTAAADSPGASVSPASPRTARWAAGARSASST